MGQTKAILLTIILVLVGFLLQVYYINFSTNNQIKIYENTVLKEARTNFNNFFVTKMWNTTNKGVFVKNDGKYERVSPIDMTKQIFNMSNHSSIDSYKITSLNPINENNKPNYYEKKTLDKFESKATFEDYSFNKNFEKFTYMAALTVTRACLECHTSQDYKIGDIRGGIRVTLNTNEFKIFYTQANKKREYHILFSFFISLLILLVLIYFVNNIYKKHQTITDISNKYKVLYQRHDYATSGSNDGLWDWNLLTNEVYFSKIWKSMLGYEDDELPNLLETWAKLVHQDDFDEAVNSIKANQRGETSNYENVHRLKHKDGSWVWILDRGKTIFDEKNNPIRMVGFHTNITKQKRLEISLKQSEQDLLKAEKMANLGHFTYNFKKESLVVSNNIKKILGQNNNDNISLEDLIKNFVHEEDKQRVYESFFSFKEKSRAYKIEYRIIRQSDREIRYVDCNIEYKKDKNSKIILAIGTIQDVTEFALIQNELSILRQAVEQAPISFVITNTKGEIEYVNSYFTKVSGYEFSEVAGKNPSILKSSHTNKEEYKNLWETITSGKTWSGTFKNITKDKEEFWEMAIISPIYSKKDKKIKNFMAVKQEITKEVHLKKELQNKEELMIAQSRHAAMGEMISMIAHQWRQPISVVSMSANNILMDIELEMVDSEILKENVKDIIGQTEYLSQTIEDFRNFFKSNKQEEVFLVEKVFLDAFCVIGKTLENNSIKVEQSYTSNTKIKTFEKELLQVLINIIKNAKEALVHKNIKDKKIRIEEYLEDDKVVIKIYDNAGGIKEEILEKIFDPYFTTKDQLEGTGLGLYMSKTIIEKHLKGSLKAYNVEDGACFEIILRKYIV